MIKILFVCLGNICRSPMAEFIFKNLITQNNLDDKFLIASAATSDEEFNNPVHPGTINILTKHHIPTFPRTSTPLKHDDYYQYDYIIAMDHSNINGIINIIKSDPQKKVTRLLDFTDSPGDIADPWYTGNFEKTYQDILIGCLSLLDFFKHQGKL